MCYMCVAEHKEHWRHVSPTRLVKEQSFCLPFSPFPCTPGTVPIMRAFNNSHIFLLLMASAVTSCMWDDVDGCDDECLPEVQTGARIRCEAEVDGAIGVCASGSNHCLSRIGQAEQCAFVLYGSVRCLFVFFVFCSIVWCTLRCAFLPRKPLHLLLTLYNLWSRLTPLANY